MANKKKKKSVKKPKLNALISFDAILKVVNKPRPYEFDDFVPESYIPDLE